MAVAGGVGAPPQQQQQPSADGGDGGTTPLQPSAGVGDGGTAPLLPSPAAMSPAAIKPPPPLQYLVLMPATAEHNLARLRWHSAQYSLQQLQLEGERLRAAVNAMLPLLLRHQR